MQAESVDSEQARSFLAGYLGGEPADLALIGAGAWSRCFGFRWRDQELVIRFGRYLDDFRKDQLAAAYASPDLPIPEVLAVGAALDGYFVISRRAYGIPLETLDAAGWRKAIPAVVDMLEALRTTDISTTSGLGGWDGDGRAEFARWSHYLLAVGQDTPDRRTYGWRSRLATSAEGEAAFAWGFAQLRRVADDAVPRCLVHSDLMNRNVLVNDGRITAVFDWGCSLYGDHLYDLAWFEFWAPWHPQLDIPLLRSELERRWRGVGYAPANKEARLKACYLHIGLDHLAYNAYQGNWAVLEATAARMRALAEPLR